MTPPRVWMILAQGAPSECGGVQYSIADCHGDMLPVILLVTAPAAVAAAVAGVAATVMLPQIMNAITGVNQALAATEPLAAATSADPAASAPTTAASTAASAAQPAAAAQPPAAPTAAAQPRAAPVPAAAPEPALAASGAQAAAPATSTPSPATAGQPPDPAPAQAGEPRTSEPTRSQPAPAGLPAALLSRLGTELLAATTNAGIPSSELDVELVRLSTGENVVRVYSDQAFLQSVRQWHPSGAGQAEGRPLSAGGAVPEPLVIAAIPGLNEWVQRHWRPLAGAEPVRFEVLLSRDASTGHRAGSGQWLHQRQSVPSLGARAAEAIAAADVPSGGSSQAGPGGVLLHQDASGQVRPVDRSGHIIQQHELEFIAEDQPVAPLNQDSIDLWARGEVPLGMPPELWEEWKSSLGEALRNDGIDPATVDVRLKGSAAEFFSGPHKSMPTYASLAADLASGKISQEVHDNAVRVLAEWEGHGAGLPVARPFDVMYRLGLDSERSDFDLNLSSDTMFRRALAGWDQSVHGRTNADGSPKLPVPRDNHGYLNKKLVERVFPHLAEWADAWSRRLGREVSYAVFLSRGPDDTTIRHGGVSVHHRETDFKVWEAEES